MAAKDNHELLFNNWGPVKIEDNGKKGEQEATPPSSASSATSTPVKRETREEREVRELTV